MSVWGQILQGSKAGFPLALSEIAAEAFGEGSFKCHWLARDGVAQLKSPCVKHLPLWLREQSLVCRPSSVVGVSNYRTAYRCHVYAYLVRAPGEYVALNERDAGLGVKGVLGGRLRECRNGSVVGYCNLAVFCV